MYRRIAVIINPASGQDRPVLGLLNRVFGPAGVDWDVFVTKRPGDGRRYAEQARQRDFDAVAVYGGDGTIAEVASGLVGSHLPLAIFPGGTANVLSVELGIPGDVAEACALVTDQMAVLRPVDMARCDGGHFILRAGIGFEAAMVEGADRDLKDRFGQLAYVFSALQALRDPPMARYTLTIDGEQVITEGVTCIVANSGSMGRIGLSLAPNISVSDGVLDVIVIRRADLPGLLAVAASVLGGREDAEPLQRWPARTVAIEADPPQAVTLDGEMSGTTPIRAEVIPGALKVIVPAASEQAGP